MEQSACCEAARTALEAPSDASLRVSCYCEENVWRLAHRRRTLEGTTSTYHVLFVSNPRQCVAMWHQMAREDGPCFWDYHVVLMETTADNLTFVLDMDSQLSYPCPLEEYLEDTFLKVMGKYAPLFRYVLAMVVFCWKWEARAGTRLTSSHCLKCRGSQRLSPTFLLGSKSHVQ